MLIPTAIFAFAILGPLYVLLAVVATFAESISRYPVDDNISIPLSVIAVNLLISLL
jgi:dolichol kinase